MKPELIITAIISVLGSAGFVQALNALLNRKKQHADVTATNVSSILDIDARLNERVAKLEERVARLEEDNIKLKEENLSLKHENSVLKGRSDDV